MRAVRGAVTAIIINRNTREFLRDCLDSIGAQDFPEGIEVWVVDNGSNDGSPQMVLSEFPGTNLVWNDGNTGYSKACNQAALNATGEVLFFMNSDVSLSPSTVREVLAYLDARPEVGIVGPRVLNSDGSLQYSCREFPSIKDAFFHAFLGLFSAGNASTERYRKMGWAHDEEMEVDWVSGCFMAVRREVFDALGGFDEGYFMYVEDVDICWRAARSGWVVGYLPRGDVFHHIGMSSQAVPTRMVLHHHLSMLRFHRRTYSGRAKILVNSSVAAGIAVRFLVIVALNTFYRLRAALGGVKRVIMPGRQ